MRLLTGCKNSLPSGRIGSDGAFSQGTFWKKRRWYFETLKIEIENGGVKVSGD